MAIIAHVPVRLRIAPALAGGEVGALVHDAVRAGVGRSLETFEREIVSSRGGYAVPRFAVPRFRWSGQPVDPRWRAAIEAECGQAVAALTAPISARVARKLASAPEVMPPNPHERFDPRRARGDAYAIPSYDGELPAPDVPLIFDTQERIDNEVPEGYYVDWWHMPPDDRAGLFQAMALAIHAQYGSVGQAPERVALMFRLQGERGFQFAAFRNIRIRIDRRTERWNVSADLDGTLFLAGDILNYQPPAAGDTMEARPVGLSPVGVFTLAHVENFASREGLEAIVRRRLFASHNFAETPVAGESEDTARRRRIYEELASSLASGLSQSAGAVLQLTGPGANATLFGDQAFLRSGAIPVLPIAALYRESEEEGDGGGEGGEGAGGRPRGRGGERTEEQGSSGERQGGEPDAGENAEGADRMRYPLAIPGLFRIELDLGPFEGEPSLEQLGARAEPLRRIMRRIAFRLDMPTGEYCGAFLIAAAQVIGARAAGVADNAETQPQATHVAPEGGGNMGTLDVEPTPSPAIQMIRYLGGTCPVISRMTELMLNAYRQPEIAALITGVRHNHAIGWQLDFHKEHTPTMEDSVATLFRRTCQIVMMQMLRYSREQIDQRLDNFDQYFPVVEALVNRMVYSEAQLILMRDQLQAIDAVLSGGLSVATAARTWREARQLLSSSLSDQVLNAAAVTSPGRLLESHGSLERYDDGWKIRDPGGRLWTMAEIEREIELRHSTAASIDPLIHQFADIPDVARTFRDSPGMARVYLLFLLREMRANNAMMQDEVASDNSYAFRSGRISENLPQRTVPGTEVAMQGIHLLAHNTIGDSFHGNHWYGAGLDFLFDAELGRRSLNAFAETVSVLALSVLCPPLGIGLGAAIAVSHLDDAMTKERLYGSLIDPELIMTRAEMEFELFMAQFEVALSIIPDAGAIMRGGAGLARAGVRGGVRGISTFARRQLMVAVGRQIRAGLARAMVTTVLTDRVMAMTLPHILGPILEDFNRELIVRSGGSLPPEAGGEPAWESLSPAEAELVRRLEEYEQGERDERLPPASEAP